MADLFFSEYIEGSSNNKALEIYNGTGDAVDLAAAEYVVQMYFNGNTTPGTTVNLTSTTPNSDVFVLAQSNANATILAQADQTSSASWFNGDDAIVLRKGGTSGTLVDAIGQIGVDPGTEWGNGLTSTADNTLRRKSSVTAGDTNPNDAFEPSVEWDGFATDTFDGLGSYTSNGGGGTTTGVNNNNVGLTPIYTIQGSGTASPLAGNSVTTEGVVVGDFQSSTNLNGFYIQDLTGDGNSSTSDGIFAFAPDSNNVNIGDVVRLTGTVSEFANQTQIGNLSNLNVVGSGATITPTAIDLPIASVNDLERYEGMLVTFPETLTVTENFNLARFGEVSLSADGRLFNPTNSIDPTDIPASETENDENNVAAVTAQQNLNDLSQILLDDSRSTQNPTTIPFLREGNTLRVGDTTTDLTGVLGYGFNSYRVQPTVAPEFAATNPRTAAPEDVGGNVEVASFNVLNYFNGDGMGGGFPTSRGADSLAEFERQSDKIVSAVAAIDADVVGLIEIENDGDGDQSAIAELVDRLNTSGTSTYDYIRDPASGVGTDEIKVAFIYQPDSVTPVGEAVSDTDAIYNRLPVAQTFVLNSTGETFTPVVNHFKSKGGTGTGSDADQGDGQGAFNAQRTQQAEALLDFANGLKTSSGDSDVLVIGDLNAYGEEDPIDVLRNGGLVDELGRFTTDPYSFVFDGQSGRLDHALATSSLNSQVTGVTEWHINADEPRILDYNLEFKGSEQSPDLYTPTPYRSSDHDPVIVGINLSSPLEVTNGENGDDTLNGTSGRDEINGGNGNDSLSGGNGNDSLSGGNGNDNLLGQVSNDTLVGGRGDDLLDGGFGNDILTGDQGIDTFALAVGNGVDTIADFNDGSDLIRLSGFTFEQLAIAQGTGNNLNDTLISFNNERLAILSGVQSNTITSADFVVA